jgi:hypothetical protein
LIHLGAGLAWRIHCHREQASVARPEPALSGGEAARKARSLDSNRQLPVIFPVDLNFRSELRSNSEPPMRSVRVGGFLFAIGGGDESRLDYKTDGAGS